MSPKSMTPVTVPSVASRLVSVTSAWWIPLGSAARRGSTAATRSTTGWSGSSAVRPHLAATRGRARTSQSSSRLPAAGWKKPAQRLRRAGGGRADLLGDVLGDDLALELGARHGRDQPREAGAAVVVGDR